MGLFALSGLLFIFTACSIRTVKEEPAPSFSSGFEDLNIPDGGAYYGQNIWGDKSLGYTGYYAATYYSNEKAVYFISVSETENDGFSWNGVAYSEQTDHSLEGPSGQFVAMPGKGGDNSKVYGVYKNTEEPIRFEHGKGAVPQSIQITNNAYAYYSLLKGDSFAKKFGGRDGNEPDFFRLIITGLDANNQKTGETEFYLADYRFSDNSKDYIVNSWETVDLRPLGTVSQIIFSLESSDKGTDGMRTPASFCFDNLVTQPAE